MEREQNSRTGSSRQTYITPDVGRYMDFIPFGPVKTLPVALERNAGPAEALAFSDSNVGSPSTASLLKGPLAQAGCGRICPDPCLPRTETSTTRTPARPGAS